MAGWSSTSFLRLMHVPEHYSPDNYPENYPDDYEAWLEQQSPSDSWWHQQDQELQQQLEETTMDMSQYAGSESKYLKASDLQGKRPRVRVAKVSLLEFDDDEKGKHHRPALTLEGKDKQLVLNATNTDELCRAFGSDSESWIGKELGLSTKYYSGVGKEGIVVTPIVAEPDLDDDIPF